MRYQSVAAIIASSFLCIFSAFADTEKDHLVTSGKEATISVTAADYQSGVRKIVFVIGSKTNISGSFAASVRAPGGSKITTSIKAIDAGANPLSAAQNTIFRQIMRVYYNGAFQNTITLAGGGSSGGNGGGNTIESDCNCNSTKDDIDLLIATFPQLYGNLPRAQVCDALFPDPNWLTNRGDACDSASGGSGGIDTYFSAPFYKNACAKNDYVARVEVDISNADPALFSTSFNIVATINIKNEDRLTGTYKTSGNGGLVRYPLVLLDTAHAGGTALVQTWKGGALIKQYTLTLGKTYTGHGGNFGVYHVNATGKKQTLVMTDLVSDASSACVLLGRSRVNFNGFK